MSLATFKKKSINSASSATKRSGKPTNQYWNYQGPYGRKGSLASTIFLNGLIGPNGQTGNAYNASNAGFSINGALVAYGGVGRNMKMSKSSTPFRGIYPKGWGGTHGRYPDSPDNYVINVRPGLGKQQTIGSIVNPSVLSNRGMLARKYRWINNGQYPNNWVQPNYTGNQTDSASQGLYIQNKAAANDCFYDVNNTENYVDYFKTCGSTGCQTTPARGYTIGIQQANAPYTKTLHQPKDASAYTLHVQRKCQDPVGLRKPFPYAVQTGTGVLTGGTSVTSVASACNTSNTTVVPPDWYTGIQVKPDGTKTTLQDQLLALQTNVMKKLQQKVFVDVILNGTTDPSTN
jgi:hypothetical protein